MTKWGRFRSSLKRLHTDFEFPTATFSVSVQGPYNPDTGQIAQSYATVGTLDVEFVPPSADATIDTEGTHLDFDTSIRVPESDLEGLSATLIAYNEGVYGQGSYGGTTISGLSGTVLSYGEDSDYPTRVSIEGTTYELQSNVPEHGSGMQLLRLTEI